MTARSSSLDAQATASTLLAESRTITLAPSARPAARATVGSPAPDSTASVTSSSASTAARPLGARAAPVRFCAAMKEMLGGWPVSDQAYWSYDQTIARPMAAPMPSIVSRMNSERKLAAIRSQSRPYDSQAGTRMNRM